MYVIHVGDQDSMDSTDDKESMDDKNTSEEEASNNENNKNSKDSNIKVKQTPNKVKHVRELKIRKLKTYNKNIKGVISKKNKQCMIYNCFTQHEVNAVRGRQEFESNAEAYIAYIVDISYLDFIEKVQQNLSMHVHGMAIFVCGGG